MNHRFSEVQMARQRRLLKFVWPNVRSDSECIVRWMAERRLPRRVLNAIYNRFSLRQKSAFHARFAKVFRCHEAPVFPGKWTVVFNDHKVCLPLGRETMWLDWDSALSVLGHEPEIKATYEALIKGFGLPRCVFDVGANYGLHSLLFLVHDVPVVSFEPNPACHEYIGRLEEMNHVRYSVESMALGSSEGAVELHYPQTDTWLGTIRPERIRDIASEHRLQRIEVPCTTLDDYVRRHKRVPDLIKLDTEGSELQILLGAKNTMEIGRPIVIFECWQSDERDQLWRLLDSMGYVPVRLPLASLDGAATVGLRDFSRSVQSNFAAFPREKLGQ